MFDQNARKQHINAIIDTMPEVVTIRTTGALVTVSQRSLYGALAMCESDQDYIELNMLVSNAVSR